MSWNFPELREAAKMIEPDIIEVVSCPAQPIDPPRVSALLHHVPPIQGITPVLAGFTEEIRRHSGDDLGFTISIEAKEVRMRPDIGTVKVHEDRNIADHPDRTLCAISAQRLPLLEEEKLDDTAGLEIVMHLGSLLGQRPRITMSQLARPVVPTFET